MAAVLKQRIKNTRFVTILNKKRERIKRSKRRTITTSKSDFSQGRLWKRVTIFTY